MNAIRHAACTELAVRHTYTAGILRIVITDDGKGFDPQAQHAGKGMRTIRSRAKILGAALVVESTPGCGTTVRLTLRA